MHEIKTIVSERETVSDIMEDKGAVCRDRHVRLLLGGYVEANHLGLRMFFGHFDGPDP